MARLVHRDLSKEPQQVRLLPIGDTNVVCFAVAEKLDTVQQANEQTESLLSYKQSRSSPSRGHLGLDNYGSLVNAVVQQWNSALIDDDQLTVVRMVIVVHTLDDQRVVEPVSTLLPSGIEEGLAKPLHSDREKNRCSRNGRYAQLLRIIVSAR